MFTKESCEMLRKISIMEKELLIIKNQVLLDKNAHITNMHQQKTNIALTDTAAKDLLMLGVCLSKDTDIIYEKFYITISTGPFNYAKEIIQCISKSIINIFNQNKSHQQLISSVSEYIDGTLTIPQRISISAYFGIVRYFMKNIKEVVPLNDYINKAISTVVPEAIGDSKLSDNINFLSILIFSGMDMNSLLTRNSYATPQPNPYAQYHPPFNYYNQPHFDPMLGRMGNFNHVRNDYMNKPPVSNHEVKEQETKPVEEEFNKMKFQLTQTAWNNKNLVFDMCKIIDEKEIFGKYNFSGLFKKYKKESFNVDSILHSLENNKIIKEAEPMKASDGRKYKRYKLVSHEMLAEYVKAIKMV
jgi:hypothetical protein